MAPTGTKTLSVSDGPGYTNQRRIVGKTAELLLRRVWSIRLAKDGFRDLESAEDPDGPLSNAGQPSHLDLVDGVQSESAASYYSRVTELAGKLPFRRDVAIAEELGEGASVRDIKLKLKVGQGRIDRVKRTVEAWIPPGHWVDDGDDGGN
jgi:hypothetical protein